MVTFRYGFHKEPEGGSDEPGRKKERLLSIFGEWTDMVTDLIKATPEEDVLRRDIFDRPPVFKCADLLPLTMYGRPTHICRGYVCMLAPAGCKLVPRCP